MKLPDFLIVGAMKAGTTWLSLNLESHPQIFMPKQELHYFNDSKNLSKGLTWYGSHFSKSGDAIAVGEKTAGYLLGKNNPKLIHQVLPNAKILIVLRDPVARAISQINHHIRYELISLDINAKQIINSNFFKKIDKEFAVLKRGKYLDQIKEFYKYFPCENIHIIINEVDIKEFPDLTLSTICKFLGVNPNFNFAKTRNIIHKTQNSKLGFLLSRTIPMARPLITKIDNYLPGEKVSLLKPDKSELVQLYEFYKNDNRRLFDFLNTSIPADWVY